MPVASISSSGRNGCNRRAQSRWPDPPRSCSAGPDLRAGGHVGAELDAHVSWNRVGRISPSTATTTISTGDNFQIMSAGNDDRAQGTLVYSSPGLARGRDLPVRGRCLRRHGELPVRRHGAWIGRIGADGNPGAPLALLGYIRAHGRAHVSQLLVEEIVTTPGMYFNPQTEVVVVHDDSIDIDAEIFNMEEFEGSDWVQVSDETPVDEHRP